MELFLLFSLNEKTQKKTVLLCSPGQRFRNNRRNIIRRLSAASAQFGSLVMSNLHLPFSDPECRRCWNLYVLNGVRGGVNWLYRRVIGVAGMRAPPVVRGLRCFGGVDVMPPFLPGPFCQVGPSPPRSS